MKHSERRHRHSYRHRSRMMRCPAQAALLLGACALIGACASDNPVSSSEPLNEQPLSEQQDDQGVMSSTVPSQPTETTAQTEMSTDQGHDAESSAEQSTQVQSTQVPSIAVPTPETSVSETSSTEPDCYGEAARWPAAPSSPTSPPAEPWNGSAVFDLELVVSDTTRAVELVSQPGTGRLLVVGRDGTISEARDGELLEPAFLDISADVLSQADATDGDSAPPPGADVELLSSEQGLLSLAFHPDHEANGLLYTFHTRFNDGASVVTEWHAPSDDAIDMDSARTVIVFEQRPTSPSHKAGQLRFGPDGHLYIAVGDGGGSGDPFCHGRNPHTPLGSIVRIDPMPSPTVPYTIPADNPYADGVSGHPTLWAGGLRNPWRFTIDDDLLIIGDVGWNDREEINTARISSDAGIDFGWSTFEGEVCIRADYCDEPNALPAVRYSHDEGVAVVGRHVYRGSAIPELTGRYFYADFTAGWLRSVTFDSDGRAGEHIDWTAQLSAPELIQGIYGFGVDAASELYVVTNWGRRVYKLIPAV